MSAKEVSKERHSLAESEVILSPKLEKKPKRRKLSA